MHINRTRAHKKIMWFSNLDLFHEQDDKRNLQWESKKLQNIIQNCFLTQKIKVTQNLYFLTTF
jgi:hypothetical protein